jgi:hypothetical protein
MCLDHGQKCSPLSPRFARLAALGAPKAAPRASEMRPRAPMTKVRASETQPRAPETQSRASEAGRRAPETRHRAQETQPRAPLTQPPPAAMTKGGPDEGDARHRVCKREHG